MPFSVTTIPDSIVSASASVRRRGPAVPAHTGDPLPRLEARARHDHAGEVDPQREGRLGAQLVLTLAQQEVGEGDADAVHLDEHVIGSGDRVGHLRDRDVGGTGGGEDLDGAHVREAVREWLAVGDPGWGTPRGDGVTAT